MLGGTVSYSKKDMNDIVFGSCLNSNIGNEDVATCHAPISGTFAVFVINGGGNRRVQFAFDYLHWKAYLRFRDAGTIWQTWNEIQLTALT